MGQLFDFLANTWSLMFNLWSNWFNWLPGPIGVPLSIITFLGFILGVIKLIAFILDCIPFY